MSQRRWKILAAAAAATSIAAGAAEKWTYTHYTTSGRPLGTDVLELVDDGGKSTISMFSYHEYADACYAKRKMAATVTRDAEYTVIETKDLTRGCAPLRIKIRKDGTGGSQESQVNGEWVPDKLDRGLRPK